MTKRILTAATLVVACATATATPALADGAASTRNILIGGAAAAAGALLIINHNKQVHQRYADDSRRQAYTQAQANNAQAAYAAERRAFDNEVAVNAEYKHEVATQHAMIESLRNTVALDKARAARDRGQAHVQSRPAVAPPAVRAANAAPAAARAISVAPNAAPGERSLRVASASWGWGQL